MARGKKKYIETPEKMWELFEDYKKEVKDNPRVIIEFNGKNVVECERRVERPLIMDGFECFVMNSEKTRSLGIDHYFSNKDGLYGDYVGICSRIRKEIRNDQIDGGMVGQYNPSITQRLNGLTDRSEVTVKPEEPLFGD